MTETLTLLVDSSSGDNVVQEALRSLIGRELNNHQKARLNRFRNTAASMSVQDAVTRIVTGGFQRKDTS